MQEDGEFETSLDYISKTLSQTSPQKQKQTKNTCLSAGDVKSDDLVVQIFLLLWVAFCVPGSMVDDKGGVERLEQGGK